MTYDFDFFVIGAGSGGVRAARMAAAKGVKVAVAEDRYFGGTCVNVGCVPKKLFVYGSHFSEDFELAESYGWDVSTPKFDWDRLRDNKTEEIKRLNRVYINLLEKSGVTILNGKASFVDANTVTLGGKTYTAKHILIATGSWPSIPDFPGKEYVIDSNQFFFLENLPKKAIVVGGGYIALEFAGILNGLGVETHVFYRGELFLRHFDGDVRRFFRDEMIKKGINVHFESTIDAVEKDNDQLIAKTSKGEFETDLIIYATGRIPLTEGLNLEAAGVETKPNGAVKVNEHYQTTAPSVYALGDVIGHIQLTPVALAEGMALVKTLFGGVPTSVDYHLIATAVFTQPNIGTVGLTEEQAREMHGEDILIYRSNFKPMKYSLGGSEEKTLMKLVVCKSTDVVLGVHMVGPEAGEIIQGLAVALKCGATKAQFDSTIGIHPTSAEEFVTMREPISS